MIHIKTIFRLVGCICIFGFAFMGTGCHSPLESLFSKPHIASYRAVAVRKGDTLYAISRRHDVNVRDLIRVNNIKSPFRIYPGQAIRLPEKRIHIVRKFETVSSIARDRHISQNELVRINELRPPFTVYENQRLKLPSPYHQAPVSKSRQVVKQSLKKKKEIGQPLQTTISPPLLETYSKPTPYKPGDDSWKAEFVAPDSNGVAIKPSRPGFDPEIHQKPRRQENITKSLAPKIPDYPTAKSMLADTPPPKPLVGNQGSTHRIQPTIDTPEINQNAPLRFKWPIRGDLVSKYGALQNGLKNDGINIKTKHGAAIRASEHGTIVYAGNALKGYGNLVLMRHRQGYITTYAHLKSTKIRKGQTVTRGQIIGYAGATGNVKSPQLHFEIRKKRQTLDPASLLQ